MGNDEHDSKPVEGILDSGSRDIVDTLWDIPPLSFPESEPIAEEPFPTGRRVVSSNGKDESDTGAGDTAVLAAAPPAADANVAGTTDAAETVPLANLRSIVDAPSTIPLFDMPPVSNAADVTTKVTEPIEDISKDPEHDPLKLVPVTPKRSHTNQIIAGVAAAVVVVAVVIGLLLWHNRQTSQARHEAVITCERAEKKYDSANASMAAALKKATALQGTTASQVMDAQTLTKLNDAIADAQNMKTVGSCEASQSDSALRQHARSMSKQLSGIKEATETLTAATTAVTDSKAAKTKQDVIDQTRTSLRNAIDSAQELLDGSLYKVADNATRVALENAISAAQALIDGNSTDTKAMQDAVSDITTASDDVNASIAAQNQANAQSQTNMNGGTNTYRHRTTTTVPDSSSSKATESESSSPGDAETPTDNDTTNGQHSGSDGQQNSDNTSKGESTSEQGE
ncbi:FIVAR domain-containing protein [Bifidobacterium moukalabense]|uniref:FIVAR domain-containing protein n=1 Tax=Bifidobacterium moukalabense TaxID=1333651 RepID=UPI001FCE7361|nr:FIVAR domain-containing protein [Bifidobacterium moukalabense]